MSNKVLLDTQQGDGHYHEGRAYNGEDGGFVVQDQDLEKVGDHDVRHSDEAHHHRAGQAQCLVEEEESRDSQRGYQQHS